MAADWQPFPMRLPHASEFLCSQIWTVSWSSVGTILPWTSLTPENTTLKVEKAKNVFVKTKKVFTL